MHGMVLPVGQREGSIVESSQQTDRGLPHNILPQEEYEVEDFTPIAHVRTLGTYTIFDEGSRKVIGPEDDLFPFGVMNKIEQHSSHSRSHSRAKEPLDGNLKRRILTILDKEQQKRGQDFNNYLEKHSIRGFLRSQRVLNKEMDLDLLAAEQLNKSRLEEAGKLLDESRQILDNSVYQTEDERVSQSYSLKRVCLSARNNLANKPLNFETWLAHNKPGKGNPYDDLLFKAV